MQKEPEEDTSQNAKRLSSDVNMQLSKTFEFGYAASAPVYDKIRNFSDVHLATRKRNDRSQLQTLKRKNAGVGGRKRSIALNNAARRGRDT
ncbi:hypothetical protein EVAR_49988_1 [Eumeta japonica]|uniref:Uncharacterized protein n=1 Tax=Eumeta variegata TaxID=151549 RepID=A0A4C1XQC0_EUMVA|nr:hypothetical protein EVAR_49988_1 [Eumeta japonica]